MPWEKKFSEGLRHQSNDQIREGEGPNFLGSDAEMNSTRIPPVYRKKW